MAEVKTMDKTTSIKTAYSNYLFRSRLEARWAVFFDALNIKYEYESEMFDVGKWRIMNYIPDFYLPDLELFVEIKGKKPTTEELNKAEGCADLYDILILFKQIGKHIGWLFAFSYNTVINNNTKPNLYKGYSFCECFKCTKIGISNCKVPDQCNPKINTEFKCFSLNDINIIMADERISDGRMTLRMREAYSKASSYVFNDQTKYQKNMFSNKTNTSHARPTEKMIKYAKYLAAKHRNYAYDYIGSLYEIEYWNYEETSDFINNLKELEEEDY